MTTWDDLLGSGNTNKKDFTFSGGDLEFGSSPRYYAGNITRVRDYNNRITFHFEWSAAKTKRGWSVREMRKVTLWKSKLGGTVEGGKITFDGNVIYFKEHGVVKKENVVPQYTHDDRERGVDPKQPKFL